MLSTGGQPDRLADTQIRVSYRGTAWVRDDAESADAAAPAAGDRAPDAGGLRRHGVSFPIRLFDVLRGTPCPAHPGRLVAGTGRACGFAQGLSTQFPLPLRVVAIVPAATAAQELPGIALLQDAQGAFAQAYGGQQASFLVRPDGYIGWRGPSWRNEGLLIHLRRTSGSAAPRDLRLAAESSEVLVGR